MARKAYERNIAPGLDYSTFRWHDSWVHLLAVDLYHRQVVPVTDGEVFPLLNNYPYRRAYDMGSLAGIGGGFNLVMGHNRGHRDQPLHMMMIDKDIWTTGIGAGGYGFHIGDQQARIQQNRTEMTVWRKELGAFEVEHMNFGHDGNVVAFNRHGGTNEFPMNGKYYVLLAPVGDWQMKGDSYSRDMTVMSEDLFTPLGGHPQGDEIMLESKWPIRDLNIMDDVRWVQRPGVNHVVSGWPGIIRDGENVTKYLQLDPQKPLGPDGWFVRHNPRMAIGVSQDHHTVYLCAVEGRLPSKERPHDEESAGLRLKEFAHMLVDHGCWDAVNMDGGGSASMRIGDTLVSPGCYNTSGTINGVRPDHFAMSVF